MRARLRRRVRAVLSAPLLRRLGWHVRRIQKQLDVHLFRSLSIGLAAVLGVTAVAITLIEKELELSAFGASFYWALTTVLGQGDASYATSPAGWVIGWLLALFGVGILAAMTGALVGFAIDFLLKEGQGMGAAGYRDHIVVCGWNPTARDLIEELRSDEYQAKVVLLHDAERNPAGDGVYYVRGDTTAAEDLERAGIRDAAAAIVCPADSSNEADMHSILTVLAIESLAPHVRTVAEVNNPKHVPHFRRADVDELLVTSRLASRLLARTAMYPGLGELVTDIVSGGEGSELYRVALPGEYVGFSIDQLSARLRADHQATLLAVARNGRSYVNPPPDFRLDQGDDAVVVAESLGGLLPLSPDPVLGEAGAARPFADLRAEPRPETAT
jgi:voltage-gated potassium channel